MRRKEFTTNEIAEKYGVQKRVARRWCENGKFPNAYQLPIIVGRGNAWLIPASDLKDFVPPRRGRKPLANPSEKALAKRRQREYHKAAK